MSFNAHGATIDVTPTSVLLTRSQLAASLGAPAREELALADVTGVTVHAPTTTAFGSVTLEGANPRIIRFAPHQDAAACGTAVEAALRGEAPQTAEIAGLDFTAVDVETANDNWGSICQIGAIRFRNGQESESRTWLCTPPPGLEHFADINISIHGITPEDITGAQPFADAVAQLWDFLGEDILVAHNVQFDSTALRSGLLTAQSEVPRVRLACSLALARDASRAGAIQVDNHKLPTVAAACGAESFTHHDATADARACGLIVVGLAQRFGYSGSVEGLFTEREFTLGVLDPDAIIPVLRAHTAPTSAADLGAGTDFRDKTRRAGTKSTGEAALFSAPTAESTSAAQSRRGPAPWQSVATPDTIPAPNLDADPEGVLFGQNVTLTGEFAPFDKGLLWKGIADRGGTVGKNVTKKTTILVVGDWATKTSKEQRAEALNEKGQGIAIWPAAQLLEELQLNEEPPF